MSQIRSLVLLAVSSFLIAGCGSGGEDAADDAGGAPKDDSSGGTGAGGAMTGGESATSGGSGIGGPGRVAVFGRDEDIPQNAATGATVVALAQNLSGQALIEQVGDCRRLGRAEGALIPGEAGAALGAGLVTATSSDLAGTSTFDSEVVTPTLSFFDDFAVGGESFAITSPGGTSVGAFSVVSTMPLAVLLDAPVPEDDFVITLPAGSDLALTWTRGTSGVVVDVRGQGTDSLICRFDSLAGAATVPSSVLSAAGVTSLQIRTVSIQRELVNDGLVDFELWMSARHKDQSASIARIDVL